MTTEKWTLPSPNTRTRMFLQRALQTLHYHHFTCNKRQRSQALLHCNLRNRRQIKVRIMWHEYAAEKDRHNPCNKTSLQTLYKCFTRQMKSLCQSIWQICEDQYKCEFQRRCSSQVDMFEQLQKVYFYRQSTKRQLTNADNSAAAMPIRALVIKT